MAAGRRPWRIAYTWENGIKGTITESSYDRAELRRDELLENADRRDMEITVTITNRDDKTMPPEISTNHERTAQ